MYTCVAVFLYLEYPCWTSSKPSPWEPRAPGHPKGKIPRSLFATVAIAWYIYSRWIGDSLMVGLGNSVERWFFSKTIVDYIYIYIHVSIGRSGGQRKIGAPTADGGWTADRRWCRTLPPRWWFKTHDMCIHIYIYIYKYMYFPNKALP